MEIPRKVQLTGRNTYIVSLPHEWVGKHSIGKGSIMYTREEKDGSLVLSLKEARGERKTISIQISENRHMSMRNIVAAYVGGAGTIVIKGKGVSTFAEEARKLLSGVEISDEHGEEVSLRVMSMEELDVDKLLKRAFNVTQGMAGLCAEYYRSGTDHATEIARKEDEADRLYLLILRSLCIGGYPAYEAVFKAIAAKSMEKASDHLTEVYLSGQGGAPNEDFALLVEKSFAAYSAAYKAFSENMPGLGAFTAAMVAYSLHHKALEEGLKKEKNLQKVLAVRSLLEKCRKVVKYAEDVMESSTDLAFAQMEGMKEL
ncbi:MAG TPA: phosphate uptake regulator PhoU [Candidatus Bilamarchaeum sp.]|nr:phosphate uptake regulator PhoU [Candidatus Bilamarchaeum sp.]